jgi:hypothetical protein
MAFKLFQKYATHTPLFPPRTQVLSGGLLVDAVLGGEILEGIAVGFGEQIEAITAFVENIGTKL